MIASLRFLSPLLFLPFLVLLCIFPPLGAVLVLVYFFPLSFVASLGLAVVCAPRPFLSAFLPLFRAPLPVFLPRIMFPLLRLPVFAMSPARPVASSLVTSSFVPPWFLSLSHHVASFLSFCVAPGFSRIFLRFLVFVITFFRRLGHPIF